MSSIKYFVKTRPSTYTVLGLVFFNEENKALTIFVSRRQKKGVYLSC
ncbi:hypothetical protein EDM60_23305 [Brevibacillus parabrevis]|nr:hypothetical protein EDM60_23305 [Brevibacillus parabrevis]